MEKNENNWGKQGYKPAVAEYFSGSAWVKTLVAPDAQTDCIVSDVAFEPGVRNNWHTHPSNQILIVKQGTCYYQEEGKPVQQLGSGEVVNILPGIKHWHGASPDSTMIHTAININIEKGVANWMEPVTDEQYTGK
jgi:quercetin dioxygenase-like cupin family protein